MIMTKGKSGQRTACQLFIYSTGMCVRVCALVRFKAHKTLPLRCSPLSRLTEQTVFCEDGSNQLREPNNSVKA